PPSGTEPAAIQEVNAKLKAMQWNQLSADDTQLLSTLYDGEVAAADDAIRSLFAGLAERHLLDDAIVVITADHGEEFKDHDGMSHGTGLYGETIRVPLIVLAPGYAGGQLVTENVSLVDVVPTVLELTGLTPERAFEGRSLTPLLTRLQPWWRPAWLGGGAAAPA